jgi:nitrilase
MKVAAVQMVSTPRVADNLAAARRLVARAADEGAELVALPEYFCIMGLSDRDKLGVAEEQGDGPIQSMLSDAAREHGVWLIGGTVPLASADPEHVFNASLAYASDGSLAARYDKTHLFRYTDAEQQFDERRVLREGAAPVAFDADGWRVGMSVCYDLRFPELYRALTRAAPCDLLAVPSAFTATTGRAHWEVLLRARAIENQAYVIAPAQGGRHESGRRTWGHSLIVDPWGELLGVREDDGEGVVIASLDRARLAAVREQLPALQHRRFG